MLSIFSKARNSVVKRCQDDEATRLRQRYNPYYHTFDRQEGTRVYKDGKPYVMLCSNDYLGFGRHPRVLEAAQQAMQQWGSSTTGARLANGSRAYHTRLEEKLADFLGKEACHISSAGYLSCMAAVESFARKGDVILVDKNVHSSLWAGIGLTQARVERFSHNNPEDFLNTLNYEQADTAKIVVLEGVYSMEGHIGQVREIIDAGRGRNCFYVMDDSHGLGVLGENGRGTANHLGVTDEVDIIAGSFSKALSGVGGYVAGDADLIEYLRTHSKQMIFSAAISPAMAACAEASLELLQAEPQHHQRLWDNVARYRALLESYGLDTWGSMTPAMPIVIGSKEKAYRFWQALLDKGVFSIMSIAPAVPPGKDLIRTAISAAHTDEDFEIIDAALAHAVKKAF